MSGNFHTSGYTEETNEMIGRKIKSTLRKIHKLKRENLALSDRRKSILQCKSNFNKAKYHYYCKEDFQILFDISERIGKNGNKIQLLRNKISQLKKSLIPLVDEFYFEKEVMYKVYFKEVVEYYDNGCSCCEPMETTNYTLVDYPNNLPEDLHNKLMDSCRDTSEQYRCLVNTSYVFSNTSLEYHEYIDWCYNLFNYEQMEEALKQDGIEILFL